jgi:hypothetical protein
MTSAIESITEDLDASPVYCLAFALPIPQPLQSADHPAGESLQQRRCLFDVSEHDSLEVHYRALCRENTPGYLPKWVITLEKLMEQAL